MLRLATRVTQVVYIHRLNTAARAHNWCSRPDYTSTGASVSTAATELAQVAAGKLKQLSNF